MKLAHPKVRWTIGIALVALVAGIVAASRRGHEGAPIPEMKKNASAGDQVTERASNPGELGAQVPAEARSDWNPNAKSVLPSSSNEALTKLPPIVRKSALEVIEVMRQTATKVEGAYRFGGSLYGASLDQNGVSLAPRYWDASMPWGSIQYTLESITAGGKAIAPVGAVEPKYSEEKGTLTYLRGEVEERYTPRGDALEQDFLIRSLPSGGGDLVISGLLKTTFEAPIEGTTARRLSFTREGKEAIFISDAVVLDAAGRRLNLDLAYAGGKVTMTVPSAWLADATLPILVDPLIGSAITIDAAPGSGGIVDCAFNSASNEWLVVWSHQPNVSSSPCEILGQRISSTGTLVGSAISIAPTTPTDLNHTNPSVAYCSSLNKFLVVWLENGIAGRVVPGDGSALPPKFSISTLSSIQSTAVASNGSAWLTVWRRYLTSANQDVYGTFVSGTGTVGTTVNIDTDSDAALPFGVAYAGGVYTAIWKKGSASIYPLVARTINATTQVLGAVTTLVSGSGQTVISATVSPKPINASSGQFLVAWNQGTSYLTRGMVVNQALGTVVSPFTIATPGAFPGGIGADYCPSLDKWLVVYGNATGDGTLYCNQVSGTGVATTPAEQLSTGATASWPDLSPRVAFNSSNGQMLTAFARVGAPSYSILAQRYQMPVAPPTPPPTPTGISAIPGNGQIALTWSPSSGATGYMIKRSDMSGGTYTYLAAPTTTSYLDTGLFNGQPYWYLVTATSEDLESANPSPISATPAATTSSVLFVVGNITTLSSGDNAVRTRLQGAGYSVALVKDSVSATSDSTGKAAVLISSTVTSSSVGTKFRDVTTPVINCESGLSGTYMGMTGTAATEFGTQTSQTALTIPVSANGHALTAGLTGSPTVTSSPSTLSWGKPLASAALIATLTSPNTAKAAIFAYEVGASMPGLPLPSLAPARRVGFFVEDITASALTTNGWLLFDAAIRWAVNAPSAPTQLNSTIGSGSLRIDWRASPGAMTYNILRSQVSGGPYTTIATGLTSTSFFDSGLTNNVTYFYRIVAVTFFGGIGDASAEIPVMPQAGPVLEVGVLGPGALKALRPNEAGQVHFHTGIYKFYVYSRTGNTFAAITPASVTGTLVVTPVQNAGKHKPLTVTKNSSIQWTVSATTEETDIEDISSWEMQYTASVSGFTSKTVTFVVDVTSRSLMHFIFHFPTGPGQTQRKYPQGVPNKFFVADDPPTNTRANNRFLFVNWLVHETEMITRQVPFGFYFSVDEGDDARGNWPPRYWEADGSVMIKRSATELSQTALALGLQDAKDRSVVNVYFVKKLTSLSDDAGGCAVGANAQGFSTTIIIADPVNLNNDLTSASAFAHEIGHSVKLRPTHIEKYTDLFGWPNDLRGVIGDYSLDPMNANILNPLNVNVMRPILGIGVDNVYQSWLDNTQVSDWQTATRMSHPARKPKD